MRQKQHLCFAMAALLCLCLLAGCSGSKNAAEYLAVDGIDLDLTQLSGTMVYAEVFNMRYEPEDYYGKVIRIQGLFSAYTNPLTGDYYYNCIIPDATACCAQGIQFFLADETLTYPEDFPENGDTVTVWGTYEQIGDAYMGSLIGASMEPGE